MGMVMVMAMGVTTMVALETGEGGLGHEGEKEDQGELPVHGELACWLCNAVVEDVEERDGRGWCEGGRRRLLLFK